MTQISTDHVSALVLPACIDLDASRSLLADITSRLASGRHVEIDASQIEQLELPGLQLVLAASRTANVAIRNPSQALTDCFTALALPDPTSQEVVRAEMIDEPEAEAMTGPTRVLAIDDSKTMRDMLRLTLTAAGFDVVLGVDGMDGLDVLTRESVDVIITDINMPKLDGYGVIESLRGDARYDATPILVLTTESDTAKKQRARDLGATGFIVKPFDPETLVQVIHKVFPRGSHERQF